MTPATMSSVNANDRIRRLSAVSERRVLEPSDAVPGTLGTGQLVPDELLSVAGLDLARTLTADQRVTLSREEVASITTAGVRFEAVLTAGFALQIADSRDFTDPRVTYLLHEIGEESRHSRLFVEMVDAIQPSARNPLNRWPFTALFKVGVRRIVRLPALLYTLVLGGEEIPDLFQKLAAEHPDTDPYIRAVNRYHRQEEARHLAFARTVLSEVWAQASSVEKRAVRVVAPVVIRGMFDTIVHPGVYESVGLPSWETWRAVRRSPQRIAMRHEATRPVLDALIDAGAMRPGHVPRGWQRLCGVNRHNRPA